MKILKLILLLMFAFFMYSCSVKENIFLVGEVSQTQEINEQYLELGVTIPEGYTVVIEGNVDTSKLGQNILQYTVLDNEGVTVKNFTRVVIVIDTIAPTFNTIEDQYLEVNEYENINWQTYVSDLQDNSNLEISLIVEENINYSELGIYPVSIKAVDKSGNEFAREFDVNIIDTQAPVISFNSNYIYVFGASNPEKIISEISDNYYDETEITILSDIDEVIDKNETGTHTVTYQISDPLGNQSIQAINIEFVLDVYSLFEKLFINDSNLILSGYRNSFTDGDYYYWLNLEDGHSITISIDNRITYRYKLITEYGEGFLSISSDFGLFHNATIGIHIGSGINNYTASFVGGYDILSDNLNTNNTFQSYTINYLDIPKSEAEGYLNDNLINAIETFKELMDKVGLILE